MKKLAKDVNLRLSAGYLNSDVNYAQVSMDLHVDGDDYSSTFKWGNLMNSVSFMQSVGKRLALGFEMMHLA